VRYTDKKIDASGKVIQKQILELRFKLEQQKIHVKSQTSYTVILQAIAKTFDIKLNESKHNGKFYFCLEIASVQKIGRLIGYLKECPLMTAKLMDFFDWHDLYELIINKKYLSSQRYKAV